MNGPIQLTPTRSYVESQLNNEFSLNLEKSLSGFSPQASADLIYTEAVFADGKKTVEPLEKALAACKARLQSIQVSARSDHNKYKAEDWRAYWKDTCWKDFENALTDMFGFHMVRVQPYDDDPKAKYMNAWVYSQHRYPIEALVTDKGFYDESRSLIFDCVISVGLIQALEADELVGIVLHEIGHGIDPALVDIKYRQVNAMSAYLTDRRTDLIDDESRDYAKGSRKEKKRGFVALLLVAGVIGIWALFSTLGNMLKRLFLGKEKIMQIDLNKIKNELSREEHHFNRQNFSEAFADNIARMYGYGVPMARGLKKMEDQCQKALKESYGRESTRQQYITKLVINTLKDEHKTDIHRIHALLKEYDADINDPKTPAAVKKQLEQDKQSLEKVYKAYTKDYDEFQNRANQLIMDALTEEDAESDKPSEDKSTDDKPKKDDAKSNK